jgi:hypothetical protein
MTKTKDKDEYDLPTTVIELPECLVAHKNKITGIRNQLNSKSKKGAMLAFRYMVQMAASLCRSDDQALKAIDTMEDALKEFDPDILVTSWEKWKDKDGKEVTIEMLERSVNNIYRKYGDKPWLLEVEITKQPGKAPSVGVILNKDTTDILPDFEVDSIELDLLAEDDVSYLVLYDQDNLEQYNNKQVGSDYKKKVYQNPSCNTT